MAPCLEKAFWWLIDFSCTEAPGNITKLNQMEKLPHRIERANTKNRPFSLSLLSPLAAVPVSFLCVRTFFCKECKVDGVSAFFILCPSFHQQLTRVGKKEGSHYTMREAPTVVLYYSELLCAAFSPFSLTPYLSFCCVVVVSVVCSRCCSSTKITFSLCKPM